MFGLGDIVELNEDFEGSITVAGWKSNDSFEDCTFEVASFEEFTSCHPKMAKKVKNGRTGKDIFLKCIRPDPDSTVFIMRPISALMLVEAGLICKCPIQRLFRGRGHYSGCPESTS